MALPPRGPSSAGQRCEGCCVGSRAEAGKGDGEILDLEASGCSHFQQGAPWVSRHQQVTVIPTVSCEVTTGLLVCPADGRTWELVLLC